MSRILLGVTGGIAAYKALELVRLATGAGHAVRVVQTPTSTRFVGSASFAALTGAPVLLDEFEPDPARGAYPGDPVPEHAPISHLALVHNADVMLVAPASANTLAKLAAGLADNLLTSAALAATCPLLLAPAMNHHMWRHPATVENMRRLRERGATVIGPGEGRLASHGEQGEGRLAEPPELLAALEAALAGAPGADGRWRGVRVLVTAGGTREPIDAVRYVGNRSSGRMGAAIAAEARARGAEVTLIGANLKVAAPEGVALVRVQTAAELQHACEERFEDCDVLVMAAAVADFRPVDPQAGKIKKDGRDGLRIELEPTTDIISTLAARRRPGQRIVGFAAESGEGAVAYGRGKLEAKGLDAVVVNDISRPDIGFEVDANEVTIVTRTGERALARDHKRGIAAGVLDAVEGLPRELK
ncbi:MAG TPA: bifunctional phosphopantothenoylcysteine decarboxylase/phosphopantothenate--cysteine ligase CoaBC [Solirubrobacteraceae bacterium]|jgi:phosphopantothenoylcysteine decarboxylase/phosphopantothenate--cysteine ligase|nr:bifunctional phosphopantothenoylcysteine decarboxylase/phosphopantothenate--cysteine ligase CoaBC [Solirubrobacteraceae bacterium]